jgi:hypothetical protein
MSTASEPLAELAPTGLEWEITSQLCRPRASRISLGYYVSLRKDAWLNVADDNPEGQPVIIEDNCAIGYGSIISAKNHVRLERDVHVARSVLIVDHEDLRPAYRQARHYGGRTDSHWAAGSPTERPSSVRRGNW